MLKAADCYKRSIKANVGTVGVGKSHYSLRCLYEKGIGVPHCFDRASFHMIYAADRHSTGAQWKTALMCETGTGVDKHPQRSFLYFDLAARKGHSKARLKIERYIEKGHGVEHPRITTVKSLEEIDETEFGRRVNKQLARLV